MRLPWHCVLSVLASFSCLSLLSSVLSAATIIRADAAEDPLLSTVSPVGSHVIGPKEEATHTEKLEVSTIPSSSPVNNSILPSNSSIDTPEPYCFDGTTFVAEPNAKDCFDAARQFKADPFYDDNITYTVVPRRAGHEADRAVPLYWVKDTCAIYVGASKGAVDEKFSLESQWPRIHIILQECVIKPKPGFKFGGMITIGMHKYGHSFLGCVGTQPRGCAAALERIAAQEWEEAN